MNWISSLSPAQLRWFGSGVVFSLFVLVAGVFFQPTPEVVDASRFTVAMTIRETAPALGVTGKSPARDLKLPLDVDKDKPLAELGIDHAGSSRLLTPEMIQEAERVFCMTQGHVQAAQALVQHDPVMSSKITLLDPDGDLDDPIGMGQAAYDALARVFMELIPRRLKEVMQR